VETADIEVLSDVGGVLDHNGGIEMNLYNLELPLFATELALDIIFGNKNKIVLLVRMTGAAFFLTSDVSKLTTAAAVKYKSPVGQIG